MHTRSIADLAAFLTIHAVCSTLAIALVGKVQWISGPQWLRFEKDVEKGLSLLLGPDPNIDGLRALDEGLPAPRLDPRLRHLFDDTDPAEEPALAALSHALARHARYALLDVKHRTIRETVEIETSLDAVISVVTDRIYTILCHQRPVAAMAA